MYGYGQITICGESCGDRTIAHAWPKVTISDVTRRGPFRKSRDFPPQFFPVLFSVLFPVLCFPCFSPRTFFFRTIFSLFFSPYFFFSSYFFFLYFFPVLFFPVLFSRTFSKVATFEIQRFELSVSCFSSTCRYITVHVPCRIAIQTSPVELPLDGWGARMRDLKGLKTNLFNLKDDWNVL